MQAISDANWRTSFIARHRRVLRAYQDVLGNGSIPAAERDAVIERMSRATKEIRDVEAWTNTEVAA
jgi:hypothetical protein